MSDNYVVCDGCGFYYGRMNAPVDCIRCGSQAKWAFPTEQKAREYSVQVELRPGPSKGEPQP